MNEIDTLFSKVNIEIYETSSKPNQSPYFNLETDSDHKYLTSEASVNNSSAKHSVYRETDTMRQTLKQTNARDNPFFPHFKVDKTLEEVDDDLERAEDPYILATANGNTPKCGSNLESWASTPHAGKKASQSRFK